MTLVLLVATVALSWLMRGSRFGLQLLAIRDDEERARGLGVRVGRVKLAAFVASAIPVGMAGALYAYFIGQIFPQFAFDPLFDISLGFFEDYFANRPVILRGLTTRWPARTKWTLEYFAERFGDELVEVTVDRDSDLHYEDRFMFHPQLSRSVLAPRL